LIDPNKWRGVESGHFSFTISEQKEWSYLEDCEYYIACAIEGMKMELMNIRDPRK